jgi:beta-N-acetylhexosaminidase
MTLLVVTWAAAGCAAGAGSAPDETPSAAAQSTTTVAPTTTSTVPPQALLALGDMSLRQKAAQVLLLAFSGTTLSEATAALLADGPPGGLLIFEHNVTGAEQVRALTAALQDAAAATGSPVGLLIAVDQEGGRVQRIKDGAPGLPSARTLGTGSTPAEAASLAGGTAAALLNLGVNMNLAPVADVVEDQGSFLYDRTYGGDAELVSSFVAAVTRALEDHGLIAVVKHFPGHGSAAGNTHTEAAVSQAGQAEFESVHLPPFEAAIAAGVDGVLMSYVIAAAYDPESPACLSAPVVTGLLREDLDFDGLVVADDLYMMASSAGSTQGAANPEAQVATEAQAAVAALRAGCDLLVLTEREVNSKKVLDAIVAAVQAGTLSEARLDEATLRVLTLKFRHGIVVRGE